MAIRLREIQTNIAARSSKLRCGKISLNFSHDLLFKGFIIVNKKISYMILVLLMLSLSGCAIKKEEVVVYTSVDQVYSEPIFNRFEKETGIQVKAVYDIESQKTVGLAARLEAEKEKPVADVFWSGEFTKMVDLMQKEVISTYDSFGGRVRVLLVNTELVAEGNQPQSIFDLVSDEYRAYEIAIAKPLFGTTFSHACALYAELGDETAFDFFKQLKRDNIMIVEGNSVVRDMVASGSVAMGLTDTDDAYVAVADGKPVKLIFLDTGENGMGTLITPNTVGKIKNGPNNDNAQQLIDYLLSDSVAVELYNCGWIDVVSQPEAITNKRFDFTEIKAMQPSYEAICEKQAKVAEDLKSLFLD
jgi:iron(III) transport system substrate-binding protein